MIPQEFRRLLLEDLLPAFRELQQLESISFDEGSIDSISPMDAQDVLRAIESGVVQRVTAGHFTLNGRGARQSFFWHGPRGEVPRRVLFAREAALNIAGAGRLHLDYGWPLAGLEFEAETGAFDLAARVSPGGPIVIAAESKSAQRDCAKLLAEVHACGEDGLHEREQCGRNGHQKFAGLIRSRADYFLGLAPDTWDPYGCTYVDGFPTLAPVDDVPQFEEPR